MDVLILGGGGREHALAWMAAKSPRLGRLFAAPGSGAIAELGTCVALDPCDGAAAAAFARAEGIDLVIVGPEAPLAAGAADALRAAGIAVFGPDAAAARLETSKSFCKAVCDACGAPTAAWARFEDPAAAAAHIRAAGAPIVVKADGLAAGKGVVVAETVEEAVAAAEARLGRPGEAVVVEAFMAGEEASLFVLCDGETAAPFGSARDHKRAFDGDRGPNTGGMGAYSPAPVMTAAVEARAMAEIVRPVLDEMARRETPYRGVLYAGLMIEAGAPRLVEINARFGDPELQALALRFDGDLLEVLAGAAAGRLDPAAVRWRADAAVTVVMAAKGYPGAYARGEEIRGVDAAAADPDVVVFEAGVRRDGARRLSDGGRVLNVAARGPDVAAARRRADAALEKIDWPGGFHRGDIAAGALGR